LNLERLLGAVIAARIDASGKGFGEEITDPRLLLGPAVASNLRQRTCEPDLEFDDLSPRESDSVRTMVSAVTEWRPAWRRLTGIPCRYRKLIGSEAISASSFAWPQHVFLGDKAFLTEPILAEQLVHELAHCWLYFFEELADFQSVADSPTYTLPSGTSDRHISHVIGALHVSAAIYRLWTAMPVSVEARHARLVEIWEYHLGCRKLIEQARQYLSHAGRSVVTVICDGLDSARGESVA
jgi:hypothetical protein